MGSPLVRAAFAVLVAATIAAFIVTQQLKGEFPLVLRFAATPNAFSPNGDGVRDDSIVGFDLSERAKVSFAILDSEGHEVRRLVDDKELAGDTKHRYLWNGRDDDGRRVPDGKYQLRVVRRDEGRVINSIKTIRVDTEPPRVRLTSARPGVIAPGNPGQRPLVRIRYRGPRNGEPEFRISAPTRASPESWPDSAETTGGRRSGTAASAAGPPSTAITRSRSRSGTRRATARSRPRRIPTARLARPGTGVAVRHLTLRGPVTAVRAGSLVRLAVGPYKRSFEFALSRLGARRAVKRDRRSGGLFRVRVPPRSRTGLYFVRVRAGNRRAVWPLAVQGGRPRGHRPLVVLPVVTWEGLNPVDDDLDGFADTLRGSRTVPLTRPFARGAAPRPLTTEAAPLLRFLDGKHLPYDLTTDVSLGPPASTAFQPSRSPGAPAGSPAGSRRS